MRTEQNEALGKPMFQRLNEICIAVSQPETEGTSSIEYVLYGKKSTGSE